MVYLGFDNGVTSANGDYLHSVAGSNTTIFASGAIFGIAITGAQTSMPASLAYWPRKDWALIAYDDAGMVFARRAAFTQETSARWEMWGVVPDATR